MAKMLTRKRKQKMAEFKYSGAVPYAGKHIHKVISRLSKSWT